MMKKIVDLILVTIGICVAFVPMLVIALIIKATSKGPIFYVSKRIGVKCNVFLMPKFRTMKMETPEIATHELAQPEQYLTSVGGFLRRTSLDELPQLFSVLQNNMSLVGPRPALYNQYDLIELRQEAGVNEIKPGITGLAQISGRDELGIEEKVRFDAIYLQNRSIRHDARILYKTIGKLIFRSGVSH